MKTETKIHRQKLRKASDHLAYEIWMFKMLAHGLASGIAYGSVIHNALLEAFAIHVRVLILFLYPEKDRTEDDVAAEDFFSSPKKWLDARPKKK